MRYVSGHNAFKPELRKAILEKRSSMILTQPIGYCQCGCGEATPLSRNNSLKHGWLKGEPTFYLLGHSNRRHPHPRIAPKPIDSTCLKYPRDFCQCGCGERAPVAKRRIISLGFIVEKGEPIPYKLGHRSRGKYLPTQSERQCTKCGQMKPANEFDLVASKRRLQSHCKSCKAERYSIWQKNNPDNHRRRDLHSKLRAHGVSPEQYAEMVNLQNNLCSICNSPETRTRKDGSLCPLSIDHCHKTNRIRKLLCRRCNVAIGLFNDDIEWMEKALAYLKENS